MNDGSVFAPLFAAAGRIQVAADKRGQQITAETAIALAAFFRVEPEFWANLQTEYDLRREEINHGAEHRQRVTPLP